MPERIGQKLGNYHLTKLLGEGSFARVYLGEHIELGTKVAIKILHTRVSGEGMAPFRQEARLLASLRHPNIVRVLDFGIDEGTPYLIMDYAPNGTLRSRYPWGTRLPVSTVVDYANQIAQGLQYAHDRKIVHRDIKPENILMGEDDEILLSDFGIALITQSSGNQRTDMAGTIPYMAPEQISAHARLASDQYSLGIVVYEWLCGTVPFSGSLTEVAVKHRVTSPPALRHYLPSLSQDIEQVVLTALQKQPEKRFASVSAFARALEQANQSFSTAISTPAYISSGSYNTVTSPPLPPTMSAIPPKPLPKLSRTVMAPTSPARSVPMIKDAPPIPLKPRNPSRRIVLIGAVGGVVIVASGIGIFVVSQSPPPPQGQLFYTYKGHSGSVNSIAWSPDGQRIASGSSDGTVQVWNASDGGNVFIFQEHTDVVRSVAWSPLDGKRIASTTTLGGVKIWNANDGSNVLTYRGQTGSIDSLAWSPNAQRIASGSAGIDNTVQVWHASDGSQAFTYRGHSSSVASVAWSPDDHRIASGSYDNTVQVWNASDAGNVFTYTGHYSNVLSVAWSPDGKQIASGSADQTVQVWNANDGSNVVTYRGHSHSVNSVAWSQDGQRIASSSSDDTVQVWNASDGSNAFTYRGHTDQILSLAWSPDGQRIASASADKTVQVWQAV